jgi:energy-coupling factor transport system ATP-binding protein
MILRFENVSYRYPHVDFWTLRNVDLTIHPGQCVLLAGASGSGKSTLCRCAVGLIPHFHGGELSGRIVVDGLDTRSEPVYRLFSHAGLVFQNPDAQLFNRTVEAELAYGLESLGLPSAEIESRLTRVSSLTGLETYLTRAPHSLSGGEKQRVALGAILALRPRLLLLDEPFTHLDPEGAEMLRTVLRTLEKEDVALVVAEHRLQEVIADFDRLTILCHGKVVGDGPPRKVLDGDVSQYGLNLPSLVRLFRALGWPGNPLTEDEALQGILSHKLPSSTLVDLNRSGIPSTGSARHPGNGDSVFEMKDVWFDYQGSSILRGISLTLTRGECTALVGRNGAGKTTLIKHLNGLLKPKRGTVEILGRNTLRTPVAELARHVGFAWQNPNDQLFQTTVREEVLTGPRALRAYDPAWCERLFERFELTPFLERSPFLLSEGQKKRVSFAAALSSRPELVVLDEPTAGQDESFRRELGRLISELQAEGKTILLVTHDLEFAAEHATRWIALADGEIVADGPPEGVMAEPAAMSRAGLRPTQRFKLMEALRDSLRSEAH